MLFIAIEYLYIERERYDYGECIYIRFTPVFGSSFGFISIGATVYFWSIQSRLCTASSSLQVYAVKVWELSSAGAREQACSDSLARVLGPANHLFTRYVSPHVHRRCHSYKYENTDRHI